MQLSQFSDYALRVLIYAAVRPAEQCRTAHAAAAFGVSRHHVVKVVNGLRHLGYLETTRGRGGGFRLSRAPQHIRVGEVVRRTENTLSIVECFDQATNTCPLSRACGLQGALRDALDAFMAVLDRYSVADLVARPRWAARLTSLEPTGRAAAAPANAGRR